MILARRAMVPVLIGLSALAGMLCLAHATRHGIGIAPDSVSYIEAARNLGAGHGISTPADDGAVYVPMTRFPPLYPIAIAAISHRGIDSIDAVRWLAIGLLGANIVLASLLVSRCAPGARWLPVIGAVLAVSSPEIAAIHGTAQSEPLFLLLGFSGLLLLSFHLETPRRHLLVAASLLIALAFLTRYVGGALLATGALAILLAPGAPPRRRATDAAVFVAVAALPMAVWVLRNQLGAASATGRRFVAHLIGADEMILAIRSIARWFLEDHVGAIAAWLLAAGILVCVGVWLRSAAMRAGAAVMPRVLLIFVVTYLGFLVFSVSFLDAATPMNSRLLSPVYVATLALALGGVWGATRFWRGPLPAILASLLALVFVYSHARDTSEWAIERAAIGGVGFGSLDWRRSETMRRVTELPTHAPIYSNARDAIYILTGRVTRWIPAPVNAETREPRPDYLSRIEDMRKALRSEGAWLVWFDLVDWRWYLPNRPALHRRLPVRRVSSLLDGEVWGYDPSRDAP